MSTAEDPTEHSRWRPLRLLLQQMDGELAGLYAATDIAGLKPSFVHELLRLHHRGPLTIRELADSVQTSHSAASQKVAAMRAAGLVRTVAGPDGRSKRIVLTARARREVQALAAEWRATEAAVAQLEAEIPYPLSRAVADLQAALARRGFRDRVEQHLLDDPDWPGRPSQPALVAAVCSNAR